MSWINTCSNKRYDYTSPSPEMIDLHDIAHSLSQICRFTGHTSHFFSVAQHCILVASLLENENDKIHGLLHDAGEAYIGDINTVLKNILREHDEEFKFSTIKILEDNAVRNIYLNLDIDLPDEDTIKRVKEADTVALFVEAVTLVNVKALDEWKIPVDKERVLELVYKNVIPKNSIPCYNVEKEYHNTVMKEILRIKSINKEI